MKRHDVKIMAGADGRGTIEVDGQVLQGVTSFVLRAGVGEIPELELDVAVYDVSTFAEASVLIPPSTAETLVALGWTPPPEQEVPTDAAP